MVEVLFPTTLPGNSTLMVEVTFKDGAIALKMSCPEVVLERLWIVELV